MSTEKKEYLQFACKNCNAKLKAVKESRGKKGKCPECGQIIQIPQDDDTP